MQCLVKHLLFATEQSLYVDSVATSPNEMLSFIDELLHVVKEIPILYRLNLHFGW